MIGEHTTRPAPIADRPLFRPEAERFRQQRHLGTIVVFRPVSVRLLTLVPLVISGLLVLAAARVTVRRSVTGLITEPATADHTTVLLEAGAAATIQLRDHVTIETAEPLAAVEGTVVSAEAVDCCAPPLSALAFGACSQRRPCLAVQLALQAALPDQRTSSLVTIRATGKSYLSHLLAW
jgi:hypothetical protein